MKQYALALDLNEDPALIEEYEQIHTSIWPEIRASIVESGIVGMEIFRTGNRLFMLMTTLDDFSFENKSAMDISNSKVQEWEQMLWKFQKPIPGATPGEKWILMNRIFQL